MVYERRYFMRDLLAEIVCDFRKYFIYVRVIFPLYVGNVFLFLYFLQPYNVLS